MDDFAGLFARAREGDSGAREALLVRELPRLHAYVRLKCGRLVQARESMGDLVQSVCREVLQDLVSVECENEAAFRAWLYTVAHHKLVRKAEYHGAQRRAPAREAEGDDRLALDGFASFCTPSRHAVAREELARIETAMQSLNDGDRELIIEARLLGRSYGELAVTTGRNEAAVRKALSRAMARLALTLRSS